MKFDIESFREQLVAALPEVTAQLDKPRNLLAGDWWLDLRVPGRIVIVEWTPQTNVFGVSLSKDGELYGEKADWVSQSFNKALGHTLRLLVEPQSD